MVLHLREKTAIPHSSFYVGQVIFEQRLSGARQGQVNTKQGLSNFEGTGGPRLAGVWRNGG